MKNVSLNQGKQFLKKQKQKTPFVEGFVSLEPYKKEEQELIVRPTYNGYNPVVKNMHQITALTNSVNQNELDELSKMQTRYDALMEEYTTIQTKIGESSLNTVNRQSTNNPYLNKYLMFSDGTVVYVTNQGIAKPFPSEEVSNSVFGKNGCPAKAFVNVNMPWSGEYMEGTIIPTNPQLIVGSPMTLGQSCGNEGINVYASNMVSNPSSSYVGCYSDSTESSTMSSSSIGYTTLEKCQEYASENGYSYFGMQNVREDGMAMCNVSNDVDKIKSLGDASKLTKPIAIWSTNTSGSGATHCFVSNDGALNLKDASGAILWKSPDAPTDCANGGYVNPDTIQGSYGGNCVGKPVNIDCGKPSSTQSYSSEGIVNNLNDILKDKAIANAGQANWSFNPVASWTKEDPAYCCAKLVDYSYQCGNGSFKTGQISSGANISFDCSAEVSTCTFILALQLDGNMCIFRETNKELIWCTGTNAQKKTANIDWMASKGKFGRHYLKMNEVLGINEWIGSEDGSIMLKMESDGNLVLYTSELKPGCKELSGKQYGNEWINAVYQMSEIGDKGVLGKLGYIDSDSNLREYDDSMVGFTNDYQIYYNTDLPGNNITNLPVKDQAECQSTCNNTKECGAYVYQGSSQTCWLKNKSTTTNKTPNNGAVLGVRTPALKGTTTCSNKITNIDTIQFSKYNKGTSMTPTTQCNASIVSQNDQIAYDNVKAQLLTLGNDIAEKMEKLYTQDKRIYERMNKNAEQFNIDLKKYKLTNEKIQREKNYQSNIEGMQNIKPTMNDLSGMLSDSDIRVLQENYSYILWSILAIGILTVTVNAIKK